MKIEIGYAIQLAGIAAIAGACIWSASAVHHPGIALLFLAGFAAFIIGETVRTAL